MIYLLRLASLVFVVLALVPAGAHLFSLLNKMRLDKTGYLVAQRAYDGWSLFGIVIAGALLSTLTLAFVLYRIGEPALLALLAFLCLAATQAVFWTYTFPANRATENWTKLPDNWEVLRATWEYSHAASALLTFAAFLLLILRTG
ncbi:MAG: hypothetical protein AB7F09_01080 [Parvibaculaceae bacterium]